MKHLICRLRGHICLVWPTAPHLVCLRCGLLIELPDVRIMVPA